MRTILSCLTGLLFGAFAVAQANAQTAATQLPGVSGRAAEATLSNRTLELSYLTDAGKFNLENSQFSAGLLLSEDRDVVGLLGLLVPTDLRIGSFISVDIGPRAYLGLLEEENEDVMALAGGVQLRVDLLRSRELALVGSAYYAPDIVTFGSGDNVKDLAARAEARLTRRVVGYAGWRWLDINIPGPDDRTLQDQFIAGFRWRFD